MPETRTANYPLTQPEVGGSQDTWGNVLNNDLVILDRLLANRVVKSATNEDVSAAAHQTMTLHLNLPTQAAVAAGVGDVQLTSAATARWVELRVAQLMNQFIPHGLIAIWYGSFADVPAGWVICNGLNGSPDLRDRIVLAAGQTGTFEHEPHDAWGTTGYGLGDHTHAATSTEHTSEPDDPTFFSDYGGIPYYKVANPGGTGGSTQGHLPYYAVVYIMKYGAWAA
jgi:hypothetical protein